MLSHQNNIVYHYTNFDAFLAIVENKSFRLSNINYLNDSKEIKYGIQLAIDYFSKNAEQYAKLLSYLNYLMSHNFDMYMISFSTKPNSLMMFQEYSNKGNGVSIGILRDRLNKIANDNDCILVDVVYDKEAQTQIIETLYDKFYSNLINDQIEYEKMNDMFLKCFSSIKSNFYIDEHEVRLVSKYYKTYCDKDIKYRCIEKLIIPYIEILFGVNHNNLFEHVCVGPCNNLKLNYDAIVRRLSSSGLCSHTINSCQTYRTFK